MKHYTEIMAIISILLLGVFTSGCVEFDNSNSTQVFDNGKISFNYTDGWVFNETNISETTMIQGQKGTYEMTLMVFKTPWKSVGTEKFAIETKYSLQQKGWNIQSEKNITINGIPAYDIIIKNGNGALQRTIFFDMNNKGIEILFTAPNLDDIQSDIEIIINSFKISS